MELATLRRLRPALDRFVREFDGCIKTRPSRTHLQTYLNGQLGNLRRKNLEAIALEAQVPVRTLQEFLSLHRWDEEAVSRRIRERVRLNHGHDRAIGVIDETSFAKCGAKTVGVKRQYCGATGKIDNCVVTVHLGYVAETFHAILDGDLYLPEDWAQDGARREEAGVPPEVEYRPKWRIALDLINRSLNEGISLEWITADELYGRTKEFRNQLSSWKLKYVVEIPCDTKGWTRLPEIEPAGTQGPLGRPLVKPRVKEDERSARPVEALWHRGGPSWELYRIKDTDKGAVVWKIRETTFYPWTDGVPGPAQRLIIAKNTIEDETKYFLTNVADMPLTEILCVAFSRFHIEHLFREGKSAVGLNEYQVRCYRSLIRHLILSNLSLLFLAEETEKLRGEKPLVVGVPGAGSCGGSDRFAQIPAREDEASPEDPRPDRLPAAAGF